MARCRIHPNEEIVDAIEDDFAYSVFRTVNGTKELSLNLRVKVHVLARDVRNVQHCSRADSRRACPTYECESPAPRDIEDFKTEFRRSIHDIWNNRLLLIDRRRSQRAEGRVNCAINIDFVESDADRPHLRLGMLFNPTIVRGTEMSGYDDDFYRGNCARRGNPSPDEIDMRLMWEGPGCFVRRRQRYASDQHQYVYFWQNAAAHELGHYLDRGHTCQVGPDSTGAPSEYCSGRSQYLQDSLMASGNRVDPLLASSWLSRLASHHQECAVPWVGAVYT